MIFYTQTAPGSHEFALNGIGIRRIRPYTESVRAVSTFMRQWLVLIYMLVLAPGWAAGEPRDASVKPLLSSALESLACELQTEEVSEQTDFDGPDALLCSPIDIQSVRTTVETQDLTCHPQSTHSVWHSIRAPPQFA